MNEDTPKVDPTSVDFLLQVFSHLATVSKVEFPVTLNVGGLMVSGHVISRDKYYEEFIKRTDSIMKDAQEEYKQVSEEMLKPMAKVSAEGTRENLSIGDIRFIHLRDARIFTANDKPIPATGGFLWRGRINAVDGFAFGMLTYTGDNE